MKTPPEVKSELVDLWIRQLEMYKKHFAERENYDLEKEFDTKISLLSEYKILMEKR